MTVTYRRAKMEEMFIDALNRFKLGLDLEYDFAFGWGPLPDGSNRIVLAYWMFVSIPNPLLGQPPLGGIIVEPNLFATQKDIDQKVMGTLGEMREAKARVLSTQNGKEHKSG